MADEITDEGLAELRRLHEAADRAPWFLVGRPWADDRAADTYAISGSPDPHAGTAVLQWCEVDEVTLGDGDDESSAWRAAEDKQRANLACAVAARNALPGLLARLERADARIATLERERDEARAELTDRIASIMHNPDVDGGSLAAGLIREGRERERKDCGDRIATLEKERDEARTELRAFIGSVEEMTLGEGVPAGLVVMDPGSDRPRAVSSYVTTQWYEAIMDKWHRDKYDLIAMYERGQSEAMRAPLLRDRIATLEAALKSTFGAHNRCAACGLTPEGISGKAHSEDCLVGAALRGVEGK